MGKLTPPGKWHGGKSYLAKKIIGLMPPRCKNPNAPDETDPGWLHYVEPYFGMGAVLLANNPEGISEVANDLNGDLSNFWQVLQGVKTWIEFQRRVQSTPFSREEYELAARGNFGDYIDRAVNFFVHCRQSLAGRMDGFTGITRTRTRRGMNAEVSAWLTAIEGLPAVHERLKRVLILNRQAIEVIKKEDGPRTLYYLDPPYLHETRSTTGEYKHEMTNEHHRELLEVLSGLKARFLLSGYESNLYSEYADLNGWACETFDLPNNSAGGKEKERRTECLWRNY